MKGKASPLDSREIKAMELYIKWVNEQTGYASEFLGDRYEKLPYLNRRADPKAGERLFQNRCVTCHGANGQGELNADGVDCKYPPLWGEDSFAIGSSMQRISYLASFIRNNMPLGATWTRPQLSVEEAYDVAAFVLDHPRPYIDVSLDFPDKRYKSEDIPYGPYLDPFSEDQHRFGPFQPIQEFYRNLEKNKTP
jgi:thiosulfate dehydrogenase